MKGGAGKRKGAGFERKICVKLSRWITKGKKDDCLWRSAMSGGRATVAHRGGKVLSRQAGDVSAVSPEGHALTDLFYIEIKTYKDFQLDRFFVFGKGPLAVFWKDTREQATKYNKLPMMIIKQSRVPELMITPPKAVGAITRYEDYNALYKRCAINKRLVCEVHELSAVLKKQFEVL